MGQPDDIWCWSTGKQSSADLSVTLLTSSLFAVMYRRAVFYDGVGVGSHLAYDWSDDMPRMKTMMFTLIPAFNFSTGVEIRKVNVSVSPIKLPFCD
jgi:hypothetical protein